jgi:metacaspase-1
MLGSNRAVFARTLLRGHSGEDVRQLQELLRRADFHPSPSDGNFGAATHDAVVAFQRSLGLNHDGAVGPLTIAAITAAVTKKDAPTHDTATGLSLHIGLNRVDSNAYGFTVPELSGCINDANDMQNIARSKGFLTRQLLDAEASSSAVVSKIEQAAERLQPGDIFLLSYSGHGSQIPDLSEPDQKSETWVLWDRQLIDNELSVLWSRFRAGVRILLISDSCHSGTMARVIARASSAVTTILRIAGERGLRAAGELPRELAGDLMREAVRELETSDLMVPARSSEFNSASRNSGFFERNRLLNEILARRDFDARASIYRSELLRSANAPAPVCSVLLLSGCQDNQTSSDGRPDPTGHQNGAFTRALRNVWQSARDYADLHAQIVRQMPDDQTPNKYWPTQQDPAFEAQPPFTI